MKNILYTSLIVLLAVMNMQAQEEEKSPANIESNIVVGAIGGTVDVSSLGGAVYSIPIQVPEGINGMQPNISIAYNNQSGNGLLGYQWTLNGLSAITRTGATWYHDGYLHGVNMNQNTSDDDHRDRFMLDGQRLMVLDNAEYGANRAEYRTEIDNMTKVVSYKCDTTTGPAYFVAWLPNGNVAYYGTKSHSRIGLQQHGDVCLWLLDSIIDRNGNYVAYHYGKGGAHYVIKDIVYTGNAVSGINPVYKIIFSYDNRPDEETTFIGNNALHQVRILTDIEVNSLHCDKNVSLWKYKFSYTGGYGSNLYKRLESIDFYCGSDSYKSTLIKWTGGDSLFKQSEIIYDGDGTIQEKTPKYSGDFNGDGYTDLITVTEDDYSSNKTARVYLNYAVDDNNHLHFKQIAKYTLDVNISSIYVADFDGDGMDDFLFVNREKRGIFQLDIVTLNMYLSRRNENGELRFEPYDSPSTDYRLASQKRDAIIMGDFLGEGKTSFLLEISSCNKVENEGEKRTDSCDLRADRSYYISYNSSTDSFQEEKFHSTLDANIYYPADYDGDGKTELLYAYKRVDDYYTRIAKLINNGDSNDPDFEYSILHYGDPINWTECYPGDFNGDGKTDALFHFEREEIEEQWRVYLFKQSEFLWDHFFCWDIGLSSNPSFHSPYFSLDSDVATKDFVTVADFNGDGKADIMFPNLNGRTIICYGPMRRDGGYPPYSYMQTLNTGPQQLFTNKDFCLGHFWGNECTQFIGYSSSPGKNYIRSISPVSQRYEVRKITDGMGNAVEFNYKYLMPSRPGETDNGFYTLNNNQVDPRNNIHSRPLIIKAVSNLKKFNIDASTPMLIANYTYNNVLIHTKGHGILGFAKTIIDSYIGNEYMGRIENKYSSAALGERCMLVPTESLEYDFGDNLISKAVQYYSIFKSQRNEKLFFPFCSTQVGWHYSLDGQHEFEKQTIHSIIHQGDSPIANSYNNVIHETESWECTNSNEISGFLSLLPIVYGYQTHSIKTYENDDINNWIIGRVASNLLQVGQTGSGYKNDLTTYSYNSVNPFLPEIVIHYPSGTESEADQLATTTLLEYNNVGQLTSKSIWANNQESTTGFKTMYEYSRDHRFIISETEEFDENHQHDYKTSFDYNQHYGYMINEKDVNGQNTRFTQTPLGTSKTTKRPDNTFATVETRWIDNNDPYVPERSSYYTISTNYNVDATSFGESRTYYDAVGRELRSVTFGIEQQPIFVDTKYNAKGKVECVSDPYFCGEPETNIKWTSFEYDQYGRTTKTNFPDGTNQVATYNGFTVSTTVNPQQGSALQPQTTSQTINAVGWTMKSIDANGTEVNYAYNSNGSLKYAQIGEDENTRVSMEYDAAGNRILLDDPDFGKTTSTYNAYGQLVSTENPRMSTTFQYDKLGRLAQRDEMGQNGESNITAWVYDNDNEKGKLKQIAHNEGQITVESIVYEYDDKLRLQSVKGIICGSFYSTLYTYNSNTGLLETTQYPTGFVTKDVYSPSGHLVMICDAKDNMLWQTREKNAYGQITAFELGNGSSGRYEYYDDTHRLKNQCVKTSEQILQDLSYSFDDFGNLAARTDNKRNLTESFTYDQLNRLKTTSLDGMVSTMQYDDYGRILSKQAGGESVFNNAVYNDSNKPHAIRQADIINQNLMQQQDISYTMFDKVKTITHNNESLHYTYNHEHQRIYAATKLGNYTLREKYYIGNCEFGTENRYRYNRTFISGPMGVFAVMENTNIGNELHYVLKDHLGSWTTIVDENGFVEQEQSFDAWGNMRNPETWSGDFNGLAKFERGFTGHEHLNDFGLINMNGRMYDPVMSSFLSVDNYVQSPENSQNFNRYAYCLNNPLKYTDPSGEFVITAGMIIATAAIIGAGIGTYQGYKVGASQGLTGWGLAGKMALGGLIGAASGAVSAGVGVSVGGAVATAGIGGFWGGCITGGASGFVGGAINGYGMSRLSGNSVAQSLCTSITAGFIGMGTGALLGGVSSGIASSVKGNNFWNGKAIPSPRPAAEQIPNLTPKQAQPITSDNLSMTPIEEGNYTVKVTFEGDYSVYQGTKDEIVKYVGITKRNPVERFAEHLASDSNRNTLDYHVIETGLTKTQARIREQYWINYFGMEKNGGQLYNQINSIAPKYWNSFSIKIEVTNLP